MSKQDSEIKKFNASILMGIIPHLSKEHGELLLKNLDENKLKKEIFKNSEKELKVLLAKENLQIINDFNYTFINTIIMTRELG